MNVYLSFLTWNKLYKLDINRDERADMRKINSANSAALTKCYAGAALDVLINGVADFFGRLALITLKLTNYRLT